MKRFAMLLLLAACGAKAKGPAAPKGFQTSPEYAALFEKDRAWTFTVATADDEEDETAENGFKHVEDSHETTCTVAEVGEFEGGRVSHIDCDALQGSGVNDPLTGLWIADAKGVYHVSDGEMPAAGTAPAYEADRPIFASPPAESSHEETDPEMGPDPVSETTVSHEGDAWCYSWSASMGDSAWDTLCLGVDGPINGSFGWSGGSDHEATFELKK